MVVNKLQITCSDLRSDWATLPVSVRVSVVVTDRSHFPSLRHLRSCWPPVLRRKGFVSLEGEGREVVLRDLPQPWSEI